MNSFIYNQTWEDPRSDLEALDLHGDCRIAAISSAGCNLLNYLVNDIQSIDAVDINMAHLSIAKLRVLAMRHLPSYESFFSFFGSAKSSGNIAEFERHILPHLDAEMVGIWNRKNLFGFRQIDYFRSGFYTCGLCGGFYAWISFLTRQLGRQHHRLILCKNLSEQELCFKKEIEPTYKMTLLAVLCELSSFLVPLGIPATQVNRLRLEDPRPMIKIIHERVRRLGCAFDIQDNYFAWQAIAQKYDLENRVALPDYLKEEHYLKIRGRLNRVFLHHASLTSFLQSQPAASFDRYVLLDIQDWMDQGQINRLWEEIVRTARKQARVIFRTLGRTSPLEVDELREDLRTRFWYDSKLSHSCWEKDRAAVYGGFHLYVFES